VHLGLKPHACRHCDATFTESGSLKRHLSSVHLGLKPHECEWCEAAYTRLQNLKAHMAAAHQRPQTARHLLGETQRSAIWPMRGAAIMRTPFAQLQTATCQGVNPMS
jgi:hypothetical protein